MGRQRRHGRFLTGHRTIQNSDEGRTLSAFSLFFVVRDSAPAGFPAGRTDPDHLTGMR